ncbi:MAG: carboxylesterase family protein [Polyangiales bacterium]
MHRVLSLGAVGALLAACGSTAVTPPVTDASTDTPAVDVPITDAPTDDVPVGDAPSGCTGEPANAPGLAATDRGTVRGTVQGDLAVYRGVPYAAPPVGDLRFRPPAPAACFTGTFSAADFGARCPQLDESGAPTGAEDCLSLNVWGPASPGSDRRPVMVFIHGGGNNQGASDLVVGTTLLYDGTALANRGNVVVTINYRLGALGFLAHPRLDAESSTNTSGNWALLDQVAALQWVQRNIAAFGGDPSRVTLFGESAGGANVCSLIASPLASGLFQRAIIESGGCVAAPRAAAVAVAEQLITAAGCNAMPDPVACLRAKSPEEILRALPATVDGLTSPPFNTLVDGAVLPAPPAELIAMGRHNAVPLIVGTNSDETSRMIPGPLMVPTATAYEAAARRFLTQAGANATQTEAILRAWPASDFSSPWHALVALTTDLRWTCPARAMLRAVRAAQAPLAWRYYFTRGLDPASAPLLSRYGASHALELPYVFGTLTAGGYNPTAADAQVSDTLQTLWSRFAATGDPNPMGTLLWPAFDPTADTHLRVDAPTAVGMGVRTARCDALAAALR